MSSDPGGRVPVTSFWLVFEDGGISHVREAPTVRTASGAYANAERLSWEVRPEAPRLTAVCVADWRGARTLEVPRDASAVGGKLVVLPAGSLRWTDRLVVGEDR